MNFYEAQDDARKRTKWLVLYFTLSVIGVVAAVYTVVGFAYMSQGGSEVIYRDQLGNVTSEVTPGTWWDLGRFLTVAAVTTGVILIGNVFKSLQLAGGGAAVARDVGARPVDPHTTDLDEKKLVNVVEEMAIASGLPVPQVWIMDEEAGINAFAAGTEPGNAVIGVTRGCVQRLNRGELQGVIAHEFSHILNGDMKLNMRLIGWLFGIMMLSMLGKMLFHSLRFMRVRGNGKDNNGGLIIALLLAGVALIVIGSIGVFFARMIQAAISRQREYLADASAVEFTRDPSGIAGALKKIGGQQYGSDISNAKAGEASHMFFADGGMFSYGFETHPPLDVRISSIEKDWDGKFQDTELPPVAHQGGPSNGANRSQANDARLSGFSGGNTSSQSKVKVDRKDWDEIGDSSHQDVKLGQQIRDAISDDWIAACHDREYAQALIFGLLLAEDDELLQGEVSFLNNSAGKNAVDLALRWNQELREVHSSEKIALLDLCIPTLRRLTMPEYERFIKITRWMIASDGEVDIFEFMLQKVLERHLSAHFLHYGGVKTRYNKFSKLSDEVNVLLSTMAGIGAGNDEELETAYGAASIALEELSEKLSILPPERCGLDAVDKALDKLEQASPMIKKQVLHACGLAVMHDGELESKEAEMLRAVADAIGSSLPPFVRR
ncbi:MAG: Zn-dependent protease with chaperone function [Cryomorphaceae bacterium]|jgi:Zn-dependent protease with chaperone function